MRFCPAREHEAVEVIVFGLPKIIRRCHQSQGSAVCYGCHGDGLRQGFTTDCVTGWSNADTLGQLEIEGSERL